MTNVLFEYFKLADCSIDLNKALFVYSPLSDIVHLLIYSASICAQVCFAYIYKSQGSGPTANQPEDFCVYAPANCHEIEYLLFCTLACDDSLKYVLDDGCTVKQFT